MGGIAVIVCNIPIRFLIKYYWMQDFMGRKLLAMNVMWKYREQVFFMYNFLLNYHSDSPFYRDGFWHVIKLLQRSFPLTEEEYLLRLDDVANNLRCWGAVSYVRSSLAKTKERPRIGKVRLCCLSPTRVLYLLSQPCPVKIRFAVFFGFFFSQTVWKLRTMKLSIVTNSIMNI
jgi:hypothetical protein